MSAATTRRDAARSRAAIIAAARELFAGAAEVPMYEIGRRAGVGQATLYRHFPSRSAIASAVLEEYIERIEAHAHQHDAIAVLRHAVQELVQTHELVAILRADRSRATTLAALRERMLTVLGAALDRRAVLAPHVTPADLLLALNMVNGALLGITERDARAAAADRALKIALRGMCAEGG